VKNSQQSSRYPVLATSISAVRPAVVVERVLAMVAARERGYINVCTVHTMLECVDDPVMAAIVNAGTLAVPDGMPLVWLGRRACPEADVQRCYGPDLMLAVCKAGLATGLRHCLYGGAPDVLELLEQNLKAKFPRLDLVDRISPPFRDLTAEEKQQMADRINAAKPDVVWVGLGTPKQDLWMGEFRDKLEAPVLIAVGAAFNFHAGRLPQAPRWMQRIGLEWLYRLIKEPRRLWRRYLVGNPRFLWLLMRQWRRSSLPDQRA
jgi:N-acetylglucosaminyldiphosphoundecaprenol N-acetyl-beta-D-mannosaminyltransferase